MRKLFKYTVIILVSMLTACSQDEDLQLTLSQNELDIAASGGEYILDIESNFDWECDYTADWLLVRQQQNKVKITDYPMRVWNMRNFPVLMPL